MFANFFFWAADRLGVSDPGSIWQWLWRVFVRPPTQSVRRERKWILPRIRIPFPSVSIRLPSFDWMPGPLHVESHVDSLSSALIIVLLSLVLLAISITTPMDSANQILFLLATWFFALWMRKSESSIASTTLAGLAIASSIRYLWWRFSYTLQFDNYPDAIFGILLLSAEMYVWVVLMLSFLQSIHPLKRKPIDLPANRDTWPSVDIFIPTYNEPLAVVRPTVLAAQILDWPADKLRIYLLDDGKRPEFRHFAGQAGVHYLTRSDNLHAKAGNLNEALKVTQGELVAIFDCDHLPARNFLTSTVGLLLNNQKCALVQTPHHFFSADPFEKNLGGFRVMPNEAALFHGVLQDGNDLWNSSFFCGSCAVLRRGPLEEVGGIAIDTVTEDAHTALKLHRKGYESAFLNVALAAGLATESLSAHIAQRIRWARGMMQIFRIDNPFLGKQLSLAQRFCYGSAMIHFLHGLPRLIFLITPLAYLLFERHVIHTSLFLLLLYAIPPYLHSSLANHRLQGQYRHSFWSDAYESVLAYYIVIPTTLALLFPSFGKFNVTAKGGVQERDWYDWHISKPYLILAFLNLLGAAIGIIRLFWLNTHEVDTVLINLGWALFNATMLGLALGVASEARQVRISHRVNYGQPATLRVGNVSLDCRAVDFSMDGLQLDLVSHPDIAENTQALITLIDLFGKEQVFPVTVTVINAGSIGVRFNELSIAQERALLSCTFSRPGIWEKWRQHYQQDGLLTSLGYVLKLGVNGYVTTWRAFRGQAA
ncbi:MAG TPA: UDP-forming cellulose synthase catalytic subunit [Thiobacillus sp.]